MKLAGMIRYMVLMVNVAGGIDEGTTLLNVLSGWVLTVGLSGWCYA